MKTLLQWSPGWAVPTHHCRRDTDGRRPLASIILAAAIVTEYVVPSALGGEAFGEERRRTSAASSDGAPPGMVLIPEGPFEMGDPTGQYPAEIPLHTVEVSAFFMECTEVTKGLWDEVCQWATEHGYEFENPGAGKGSRYPVHTVSWHDVVKWCNARSEREGLTPVYFEDADLQKVYRRGRLDLDAENVLWGADGHRLPTEAEWEKAARGGLTGMNYPWGDDIDGTRANYLTRKATSRGGLGFHPEYDDGRPPYTSPVGSFPSNGYGLYDMVGNVWEWCWDRYDRRWYADSAASRHDPRGPVEGRFRVMRGGSWSNKAHTLRCAYRDFNAPHAAPLLDGFRCVRSVVVPRAEMAADSNRRQQR